LAGRFVSVSARLEQEIAAGRLERDSGQAAAARRLSSLAAQLRRRPRGLLESLRARMPRLLGGATGVPRGVYLWGGVGRGKTLLMDAFHASLGPVPAERQHFYRFMRGVHEELASIKSRAEPLGIAADSIANRAGVLCLDEFFVSDIADAMILAGLLEGLFRRGVTLVATSNVAPRDLYKDGLQRQRFLPAIGLIEAHLDVLELDSGTDYRLRRLERAPTYLDSGDPGTPAALERLFDSLAGKGTKRGATLIVEGRPIAAVAVGADIAWFEFRELCEGPRSQNDYIDIARLYGTVFLSNVPRLTPEDEDAARRFIMLIDELYDRGVKIVVSAAAAPGELYRGERLGFEFQRAASRLIEMRSQEYLAGRHRV
jgi:cell division protein ZapE